MLQVVGASPWIYDARGAAFLLQEKLGVARDAGREIAWQRQRLVERVRVQGLGLALRRRHRLDLRARDIVENVPRGERPTGCLRVRAQDEGLFVSRVKALHELRP